MWDLGCGEGHGVEVGVRHGVRDKDWVRDGKEGRGGRSMENRDRKEGRMG